MSDCERPGVAEDLSALPSWTEIELLIGDRLGYLSLRDSAAWLAHYVLDVREFRSRGQLRERSRATDDCPAQLEFAFGDRHSQNAGLAGAPFEEDL